MENIDFATGRFKVESKPWLMWSVKTGRELPLTPETRGLFEEAICGRKAGFVFVAPKYATGDKAVPSFANPAAFRQRVVKALADLAASDPDTSERARKRAVVAFCRAAGETPEKTVRLEFLKLTKAIGCPEYTRVHDPRHLFASRAQAAGGNPVLAGR